MADIKKEQKDKQKSTDEMPVLTQEQLKKLNDLLDKGENFIIKAELPPFAKHAKGKQ